MKLVWIVLGSLAALVAAVLIVGALLPVDHTATAFVDIEASPDSVWGAITDVEAFPTWRDDVERVVPREADGGATAWTEHGADGAIPYAVESANPPLRLVTRIDTDELPFGGSWTYQLTPMGDGATRVTVTERGQVYNPVFRFVSRFVIGHTATMERYLSALEGRFEAGA